jgi:hypothetical protein
MWNSRTKTDLIFEVWEKLDCESVGASELEAIETVLRDRFGPGAVESPMRLARLLADEGAELRHAEVLELAVRRRTESPHDAMLRNIVRVDDLRNARSTFRNLENLRKKLTSEDDRDGLRKVRELAVRARKRLAEESADPKIPANRRAFSSEIAEWFAIWLQTPEIFENWVGLRTGSADFRNEFGEDNG